MQQSLVPGQVLQLAPRAALLTGLVLLRGKGAHHPAAKLCSSHAQGFRPQDFSVVQVGGQRAEEQKYLTPAVV